MTKFSGISSDTAKVTSVVHKRGITGIAGGGFIFALGQQNGDDAKQRQESDDGKHGPIHQCVPPNENQETIAATPISMAKA